MATNELISIISDLEKLRRSMMDKGIDVHEITLLIMKYRRLLNVMEG